METLLAFLVLTTPFQVSFDSYGNEVSANDAYCQNLYWQPNATEKMIEFACDIEATESEISRVRSGRY